MWTSRRATLYLQFEGCTRVTNHSGLLIQLYPQGTRIRNLDCDASNKSTDAIEIDPDSCLVSALDRNGGGIERNPEVGRIGFGGRYYVSCDLELVVRTSSWNVRVSSDC